MEFQPADLFSCFAEASFHFQAKPEQNIYIGQIKLLTNPSTPDTLCWV